ncbi:type III pantothenate kinase [Marinitoga sp. 38H-ov]|uniref:type III pantothenate kinase n=1 Tax=Marinitoga sp. 38H-ov TaxID=1755814 RepID=UPI0013EB6821|nr:type III pantothenate kinase [Marinitoga sp. 38H-ov]KAF2956106.1 type III pantothenate kinase [Marinitoga sp. 38H-ov]
MRLLFDVGNTHIVIGLFKDNFINTWRIGTKSFETEDELYSHLYPLFKREQIDEIEINSVIISSVVPSINYILGKFAQKYFNTEAIFVNSKNLNNMKLNVDYPNEVGADRIANALALKKYYGENAIAIDFGTAITIDVLYNGNFIGGSIIPGINTQMMALFSKTAKLPQVELKFLDYSVGKNTIDNIQIGIIKTVVYGIQRLLLDIKNEYNTHFNIVITGGIGKSLQGIIPEFNNYDPYLTLKGVNVFYEILKGVD